MKCNVYGNVPHVVKVLRRGSQLWRCDVDTDLTNETSLLTKARLKLI